MTSKTETIDGATLEALCVAALVAAGARAASTPTPCPGSSTALLAQLRQCVAV